MFRKILNNLGIEKKVADETRIQEESALSRYELIPEYARACVEEARRVERRGVYSLSCH